MEWRSDGSRPRSIIVGIVPNHAGATRQLTKGGLCGHWGQQAAYSRPIGWYIMSTGGANKASEMPILHANDGACMQFSVILIVLRGALTQRPAIVSQSLTASVASCNRPRQLLLPQSLSTHRTCFRVFLTRQNPCGCRNDVTQRYVVIR